jgi:DNA-binding Lrp family transcriptional regulator
MQDQMDKVDRGIICSLNSTPGLSAKGISGLLGISIDSARQHMNRLIQNGTIRIVAQVVPERLGRKLPVLMALETAQKYDAVVDIICDHPDVTFVAKTSGRYNIFLGARFHSVNDYSKFLKTVIEGNQSILNYKDFVAIETISTPGIQNPSYHQGG